MSERVATPLSDVVSREALVEDVSAYGPLASGAQAVVCLADADEVAAVLEWADAADTTVVPVGTGGHVPAAVPTRAFVLLSTSRMHGIDIYEPADLTLTAGAGLGIGSLLETTLPNAQWLPFDPPDFEARSLGGLVATGVSGPAWTGYGELKNHVLGAHVVCGDGRRLRLGGRVVKNVAGFDLLRPVVGSRGVLAVITTVTVRLFPVPEVDRLLVMEGELDDLVVAGRAVATAPVLPVSIVLVRDAGSAKLLVRLHGARETVDADLRTLEAHSGVGFDVLEGDEAADTVRVARDHVGSGRRLHGLPADLADTLGRAGSRDLVADVYRGSVRFDGSADSDVSASEGARELSAGLEEVFDPAGVLWSPPR